MTGSALSGRRKRTTTKATGQIGRGALRCRRKFLRFFPGGFIAEPKRHIFLKPNVTRAAAREYGFEFA